MKFLRVKSRFALVLILWTASHVTYGQQSPGEWKFIYRNEKKQIDLLFNGKWMTSYCYYDSIRKPILFPIYSVSGVSVTRGFPVNPVAGETADHPHHIGLWLNYENVNGLDFWNNSTAIPLQDRIKYGSIEHTVFSKSLTDDGKAMLKVHENWLTPDRKVLLREETKYIFTVVGNNFIIDRITELIAQEKEVSFKDTKDGFLAVRVARELEMPTTGEREFVDEPGKVITRRDDGKVGTGWYTNSEGLTGDATWGNRARWCSLAGRKAGQDITITIMDHPKNTGYPTYWHARGYGLFAANPLGQEIFSKGKDKLDFVLPAKQSVTFRFRIVVSSGHKVTIQEINALADEFAARYP